MKMHAKTKVLFPIIKITIYVLIVFFLVLLSTKSYSFGKAVFTDAGKDKVPGKDLNIAIENGSSKMDVANTLKSDGLIDNSYVFYVQSILYKASFKPGKYTLNTSSKPEDVIEALSAGSADNGAKSE